MNDAQEKPRRDEWDVGLQEAEAWVKSCDLSGVDGAEALRALKLMRAGVDLASHVAALEDTLLAVQCCDTCANSGDCCCEWQVGEPDDCKPGEWGHWEAADVDTILRAKAGADMGMGRETPTTAYVAHLTGESEEAGDHE